MASPIPCAVCQQVADGDYLLTARNDRTGFTPGQTLSLCEGCLIGIVVAKLQDMAPEPEPEDEPEPDDDPTDQADSHVEPAPDLMEALQVSLGINPSDPDVLAEAGLDRPKRSRRKATVGATVAEDAPPAADDQE